MGSDLHDSGGVEPDLISFARVLRIARRTTTGTAAISP
jgi:hypothetical protein